MEMKGDGNFFLVVPRSFLKLLLMLRSAWLVLSYKPRPGHDTPVLPHHPPERTSRRNHYRTRACNTASNNIVSASLGRRVKVSSRDITKNPSHHQHWEITVKFPIPRKRYCSHNKAKLPSQKSLLPMPLHSRLVCTDN